MQILTQRSVHLLPSLTHSPWRAETGWSRSRRPGVPAGCGALGRLVSPRWLCAAAAASAQTVAGPPPAWDGTDAQRTAQALRVSHLGSFAASCPPTDLPRDLSKDPRQMTAQRGMQLAPPIRSSGQPQPTCSQPWLATSGGFRQAEAVWFAIEQQSPQKIQANRLQLSKPIFGGQPAGGLSSIGGSHRHSRAAWTAVLAPQGHAA